MAKDIILDDSGDLEFSNGDIVVKTSDEQHAVLIVNTKVGSWKQKPLVGVGINDYLGSSGLNLKLKRNILIQMQADGFSNVDVTLISDSNGLVNYGLTADRI